MVSYLHHFQELAAQKKPHNPISRLLGFYLVEVSSGRSVLEMHPTANHLNMAGVVHGGVLSTLLDSAMGIAVISLLEPPNISTSIEFKVNFIRPIKEGDVLTAIGSVIAQGTRVCVVEGQIYTNLPSPVPSNPDPSNLAVKALGTFMIINSIPPNLDPDHSVQKS